jgi:hypothetical protein
LVEFGWVHLTKRRNADKPNLLRALPVCAASGGHSVTKWKGRKHCAQVVVLDRSDRENAALVVAALPRKMNFVGACIGNLRIEV